MIIDKSDEYFNLNKVCLFLWGEGLFNVKVQCIMASLFLIDAALFHILSPHIKITPLFIRLFYITCCVLCITDLISKGFFLIDSFKSYYFCRSYHVSVSFYRCCPTCFVTWLSHVFPKEHNNHRMSKIQITESKFASLVYEKHDFPTTNILLNSATL